MNTEKSDIPNIVELEKSELDHFLALHAKPSCRHCRGRGHLTFSGAYVGNVHFWLDYCWCVKNNLKKPLDIYDGKVVNKVRIQSPPVEVFCWGNPKETST